MTYTRDAFAVTPSKPGSDVAGETVSAFASASIAFAQKGDFRIVVTDVL